MVLMCVQPKAEWANPFSIKASDCHVRDPGSWGMGDAGTMQLGTETVALLPDENVGKDYRETGAS